MAGIEKFEDIKAWQEARELLKSIYEITSKGNFSRDWELKNQIRRSTVSVMSNIAEGFDRSSDKELIQFLRIATGSCSELKSQLYVALDQKYITNELFRDIYQKAIEVTKLVNGFIRYLKKRSSS